MAWTKLKTAVVVGTVFILGIGTTAVLVKKLMAHSSSRSGRLLDGSPVLLERVTYGKKHLSPLAKAPGPLRFLPEKLLRSLKWDSGALTSSTQTTDMFVFWFKFNNSTSDQSVRYAIADENGVEAPVPFNGPYLTYKPAGFGSTKYGVARSFGLLPRRSRRFYLRLYEKGKDGNLARVANFPVENTPAKDVPDWTASSLPTSQKTNNLIFTFDKAVVGVLPREKIVAPYDSFPGEWSEFRFKVTEHGKRTTGWNVNEVWIYDATGNQIRTSKQDHWSLNGTFSRLESDEIICTHRWFFLPDEPAWKFRVRFEHETQSDFWAEYFIKPEFLRAADNRRL